MMKNRHRNTEAHRHVGMTLVEVLAVVVILGLIAGTLVVGFSGAFGKARHELAKTGIGVIVSRIELYKLEYGKWPANDAGLASLSDGQAHIRFVGEWETDHAYNDHRTKLRTRGTGVATLELQTKALTSLLIVCSGSTLGKQHRPTGAVIEWHAN